MNFFNYFGFYFICIFRIKCSVVWVIFFSFYKGRKGVYEREHDCTMSGKHC